MPVPAAPERKILDIERLRGLAVAAVVFTHLALSGRLFQTAGLDPMRVPFWLGVQLFFVISGFVVTKSFTSKAMSLRAFYVRRLFRLWPVLGLFFVLVILTNAWVSAFHTGWNALRGDLLSVLFGYYTLHNGGGSTYCGPMWSLAVEEQFYLAAPMTLLLLALLFRSRWSAACRWGAAVFALLLTAARIAVCFGVPAGWLRADQVPRVLSYLASFGFDFLALGVLLYFRTRQAAPLARLGHTAQRWLVAAALALPLVVIYLTGPPLGFGSSAPILYTLGWGCAGAAFYLVVGLAAQDRDLLRLPRPIDRVVLYLGSRSYGIYVFHYPLVVVAYVCVNAFVIHDASSLRFGFAQAAAALPVVALLSELSFRLVERPFIQMGGRLARRWTAPKIEPLPAQTALPPWKRAA